MATVRVKARVDRPKVTRKAKAASIQSLGRAGAYLRGIARRSIKVSPVASEPGKPPRSRQGRLKNAIVFAVEKDKTRVVIGPAASDVGKIGRTHEFGGTESPKKRKGRKANFKLEVGGHGPIRVEGGKPVVVRLKTDRQVAKAKQVTDGLPPSQGGTSGGKPRKYPPRPFMGPALNIGKARLPRLWANSVRG
ncbi:MAG: hypothetical protein HS116_25360 [Planctomycetes bacterium]|nr:hypothetical protein [Planctomycetota bacterium]